MPNLEKRVQEYLHGTLGVLIHTTSWEGAARLPAFLTGRYRFTRMELMDREMLLLLDESPAQEPPAIIEKHIGQVRAKWPSAVVYVRDRVTAYNRKRLIERRVPFIVPGNQMYLPELGLDLREHFRTTTPIRPQLRPATQAVLIYLLLHRELPELPAARLAPVLGYSAMTLSRALDELESSELAETEILGRERLLRLRARGQETWERAKPQLIDPVKTRHFITVRRGSVPGFRAGQDALARYSMIAEPRKPVLAVSQKVWASLEAAGVDVEVHDREEASTEIEVWKYPPREYGRPGCVDPLSLFLSLRQTTDERVEQMLEILEETVKQSWS